MLAPGEMIDHYRVTAMLGAGGMGEVYQARDEQLGRLVAIKILNSQTTHAEGRMRFLQEARAASTLNHPNIVTVYGLGPAGSRDYIAMEYVTGQSLAALIQQQRLSIEAVLDYAAQLASALEAAHQARIVHRDLKPSNIMLADSGLIKVLDFGLAKLIEPVAADPSDPAVTLTARAKTEVGAVLGTLAYMSPEQLEGKPADARSDIFAFGLVLYEMTAGRRAFTGSSQVEMLAAILRDESPSVAALRPETPPHLAGLIHGCLAKDPAARIQTMTGIREILRAGRVRPTPMVRRARAPSIAAGAVLLLVLVATAWWRLRPQPGASPAPRLAPLTSHQGNEGVPALSPTGRMVAFNWDEGVEGPMRLFVKQVGQSSEVRLTSTANADTFPAWSPDENFIAFHRHGGPGVRGVYIIPALGGAERRITDAADDGGAVAWAPDGDHLALSDTLDEKGNPGLRRLYLVTVATGARKALTTPPVGFVGDMRPAYSPDAKLLAFQRTHTGSVADIYVMPAAGGEGRPVTTENRGLFGLAWAADSRAIVYSSRRGGTDRLWRKRLSGGDPELVAAVGDDARFPSVSRQGNRLVYLRRTFDTDIWRAGLSTDGKLAEPPARFIASTRIDTSPEYSPDGSKILFYSQRSGAAEIWVADSDGRNALQVTSRGGVEQSYPRWSPDGRWIAFGSPAAGNWDIYRVPAAGSAAQQLTSEATGEYRPNWSHDGQWLYFIRDRDGQTNLWKMPPAGGAAIQVTREGAASAEESADGKFLYITRRASVWRMPVDREAEARKVFDAERPIPWGTWVLAPKGIYYCEPSSRGKQAVNFFRFQTGRSELLFTSEKPIRTPGRRLAVSPDARWLLFEQVVPTPSELMLVSDFR
jgi:Tol biopolymer transport system component